MGKKQRRQDAHERFDPLVRGECSPLDYEFLASLTTKDVGALGEAFAAAYLVDRGFALVEYNYRCPEGEADIVVFDPDTEQIVLVEVKTRRSKTLHVLTYPEEAVTPAKERRYRRIAQCYAMEHFPTPAMRFDVVGVTLVPGCVAELTHLSGAFDWDAGR